ncbi:hypothetical protein J3Q64DRAFT_1196979 [Phycomyces blakesleeanus]|uniref:Actin cytoskeleton-regulatory complex protein SLA1 n=2 Tax=Phycomyces blakesleeanus TaxID=4837 RepID=A0ABR3AS75_PHYBL
MKYVQVCKALYDYEARTPDELAMKEDDVLYILEEEDDEWWKAELKQASSDASGPVGLVPASYLTECEPIGMVRAEYDYAARQDEELSFEEGQEMLLLENDDPDWYLVKMNNGKIGLAPSNYVQLISETEQKEPHSMEESEEIHEQAEPQPAVQALPPTMPIQPIVPHMTGRSEHSTNREANDDAQSWTVHEYDAVKKKKKKGKGNLLVGNGMICYGSETDKTLPVLKYPILDVTKYLFDGKTLHIEISGSSSTVLDLQASSKSEAKAILVKITDSRSIAQMANTRVNKPSESSLSEPESNNFTTVQHSTTTSSSARQNSYTTTTSSSGQITRRESETASTQESNNPPRWAVIVYAFDAEGGEELTVKDEEQVLVLDSTRTDGWWRVEKTNGEAGLVPSSYVQFNEDVAQHRISAREQQEAALEQKRQEEEERERQRQEEEEYRKQSLAQQRADEARQKEERRIREEEERERRRKAQEASQRAENERRQQMEEEYKRKEEERKKSIQRSATSVSRSVSSAGSSNQLSRSASTSHPATELTKPDSTRVRTWTDRSGAFKVDAELLSYYDGKLRLHKTNGVKIDVPLEKMSMEDIRYVEAHTKHDILKNKEASAAESTSQNKPSLQIEAAPSRSVPPPKQEKKVNPSWDWFDWFLMIGVPMQAALIYSSAFKADKLDDSDLPTLTHKQMKGLGMKEKDVRRVERYIETEKVEPPSDDEKEPEVAAAKTKSQLEKDEELARQLQRAWNDNKDIGQNNEKGEKTHIFLF